MPVLACNPILVTIGGLNPNQWVDASLTLNTVRLDKSASGQNLPVNNISQTIPITLRSNSEGKVVDFDISPFVANFARKNFYAGLAYGEIVNINYPFNLNFFSYTLTVNGTDMASDKVLFGAGNLSAGQLSRPYLLRRNMAVLNAYEGLPFTFSTVGIGFSYIVLNNDMAVANTMNYNATSTYLLEVSLPALPIGDYFILDNDEAKRVVWNDQRIWKDADIWQDVSYEINDTVLYYRLHVHPSPADCLRAGAKIYVRYWNSRGAWSYALLDVQYNDLQAKTEYADSWRLDDTPVDGRIFGDRVQTSKEMTYTITAGRDGLDRLDVDELRDLQRSWCVQLWDVDKEAWRDCYVKDATTRNGGGRGQEMTFTIEMPHEYTFTR